MFPVSAAFAHVAKHRVLDHMRSLQRGRRIHERTCIHRLIDTCLPDSACITGAFLLSQNTQSPIVLVELCHFSFLPSFPTLWGRVWLKSRFRFAFGTLNGVWAIQWVLWSSRSWLKKGGNVASDVDLVKSVVCCP